MHDHIKTFQKLYPLFCVSRIEGLIFLGDIPTVRGARGLLGQSDFLY